MPGGRRLAAAVAALVLGSLIFVWWNGSERQLDRRLARLRGLTEKSVAETQLRQAATARKIADLFADQFAAVAEPEGYATSSRPDLIRGVIAYRSRSRSLVIDILRKQLFVDPGDASATHYAYVRFISDLGDFGGTATYPVRIQWVREGGDWKIEKLEILPADRGLSN